MRKQKEGEKGEKNGDACTCLEVWIGVVEYVVFINT
jgi:hypothetical protein